MSSLPPLSNEQQQIINLLQQGNVIVDSVAGSGKTTTNLHIATFFKDKKILLLTYNAKLKLETRERITKMGIKNLEVHSYHSFCVKYYDRKCFTDKVMIKLFNIDKKNKKENKKPSKPLIQGENIFNYDIIIVDEAQDMTPIYFQLVCKIYRDNSSFRKMLNIRSSNKNYADTKICMLGDRYQSIYQFNGADTRFMLMANKLFSNQEKLNDLPWNKCRLSRSFRITKEMSNLINYGFLHNELSKTSANSLQERIISHKVSNNKPRYLVCNTFKRSETMNSRENNIFNNLYSYYDKQNDSNNSSSISSNNSSNNIEDGLLEQNSLLRETNNLTNSDYFSERDISRAYHKTSPLIDEINYYKNKGYKYEDIFILAPSVRSAKTPVRLLANELSNIGVPIYVPVSDEEKIDEDVLKGKLCFSTFHQSKGLERPVVIVFGIDDSYFKHIKRNADPLICPNEIYVACTRAKEHLTIIHHKDNNYADFININNLEKYCNVIKKSRLTPNSKNNKKTPIQELSVTTILRHLPEVITNSALNMINYKNIDISNNLQNNSLNSAQSSKINNTKIDIPVKTQQNSGYENVSELTGLAIPAVYEFKLFNKLSIMENLIRYGIISLEKLDNDVKKLLEEQENSKDGLNFTNGNKIVAKSIIKILYISNLWNAFTSGYIHKVNQITNYNWITKTNLEQCLIRVNQLNLNELTIFEQGVSKSSNQELLGKKLNGFIDCINIVPSNTQSGKYERIIYEFKCVNELSSTHILQLVMYMYLFKMNYDNGKLNNLMQVYSKYNFENLPNNIKRDILVLDNDDIINTRYILFNILDNKAIEIDNKISLDKLKDVVRYLIYNKFCDKKEDDNETFIKKGKIIIQIYK